LAGGFNYPAVVELERLVLNSLNWKLPMFNVTCIIEDVVGMLNIATLPVNEFSEACVDYRNYILSEYRIFINFDLFEISLTIVKMAMSDMVEKSYICSYMNLLSALGVFERINECELFIKEMLYSESSEDEQESNPNAIELIANKLLNI
jgi:hypothetical protein